MRICRRGLPAGMAAAALVLAAPTAGADEEIEAQVGELRDMVLQLQDELRAERERNEEQEAVIRQAGLEEDQSGASSFLSPFLTETEFFGWVAASYTGNFRGSGPGVNSTFFYPDSNTFAVDQVWFGMDKSPTEESRAGFHTDIVFGKAAQIQGNNPFGGNDSVTVFSAYVSYLAPIGNGVQLDFGEMWTLIGAEVVAAPDNFNITRGLVWGLQPVTNTGFTLATDLGAGFSTTLGLVNEPFSDTASDFDGNKAFTGQLAWEGESTGAYLNTIVGDDNVGSGTNVAIIDFVGTWDVTDSLSAWVNYDFVLNDLDAADVHGLALAAQLAITEQFTAAVRGEVVVTTPEAGSNSEAYSATGTFGYNLTDNLLARVEYRYDYNTVDGSFIDPDGGTEDDQHLGLVQMIYTF